MSDQRHAAALAEARALIARLGREGRHHVAAAVLTEGGCYTGVNIETVLPRATTCAEVVALGWAAMGEPGAALTFSVAVNRRGEVIPPCGVCREMLMDYGPDALVAVGEGTEGLVLRPVRDLLPEPYKPNLRTLPPRRLFDTVVMVDWSAAASPSPRNPSADAIWIGISRGSQAEPPIYCRTRTDAVARLAALLAQEQAAGRRVLAGFDFPFGYPAGFAEAVTGRAEGLAVWAHLAEAVEDGPDNTNNRFAVAEALNARFPGIGPFWGRPAGLDLPGLPERGSLRDGHGMTERRLAEARLGRAQPCWKLYTTGSVGSQALLGIAALARLRDMTGAAVWPFDTGLRAPDAPLVLAEVFPSLIDGTVRAAQGADEIRDAAQVRVLAGAFAALDAAGGLRPLFAGAPDLDGPSREIVAREEAWILGLGHAAALEAAWAGR
jgi:cytidine deaminase